MSCFYVISWRSLCWGIPRPFKIRICLLEPAEIMNGTQSSLPWRSKMASCVRHFNKLKLIHELPKLMPQILNCFFVTSEVIISSALLLISYVLRKLFRELDRRRSATGSDSRFSIITTWIIHMAIRKTVNFSPLKATVALVTPEKGCPLHDMCPPNELRRLQLVNRRPDHSALPEPNGRELP